MILALCGAFHDVSNNTIINIEAGKQQNPIIDTIKMIAKVPNVSITFITLLSIAISIAMSVVGFIRKKLALKIAGITLFLITLLVIIALVFSTNSM